MNDNDIAITLALIGIAAGSLFLVAFCYRPSSWVKSFVKTLGTAGLAAASIQMGAAPTLAIALALCAVGDFALSRPGNLAFVLGAIAFGAAHVCFVLLMAPDGFAFELNAPNLVFLIIVTVFAILLLVHAEGLRVVALAYLLVISAMGFAALALPPSQWLAKAAAGLFILSDAVLALEKFVFDRRNPVLKLTPFVVWSTYFGALLMFFLAFGVLSVR